MLIFRQVSFYIALAGIVLTAVLVKKIAAKGPEPVHLPPPINPYEKTIAAAGIIEAVDKNIEVGVPHSALVKQIHVRVGDRVMAGDVLFCLDDRELYAQLLKEKANLAVLKATWNRLNDQYARLLSVDDPRAVSLEDIETHKHDLAIAEAQLDAAEAEITSTLLLIEQLSICAPHYGTILQNNIRKGEFIAAGSSPAMILGDIENLQVRADIDEQNASSFSPNFSAVAYPKNNATTKIPLTFVRTEPYVIPKKSLTGASDERVDTRVLQVIYAIEKAPAIPLYVGQQVDLFIDRAVVENSTVSNLQEAHD